MKFETIAVLIGSLLLAGVIFGHTGATGIVKERMDAMQDMGDKSKVVADMFKGKIEFRKDAIVTAADIFLTHGKTMQSLFPNTEFSRTGSETDALPRIWSEWSDFSKHITTFIESSEALKDLATTTEDVTQLRKAFFTTTKNCLSCHKRFRKPKN